MRIALAPINPTIGDIAGNSALVMQAVFAAAQQRVDLVLLPELALCGYPPKDLLASEGFVQQCEDSAAVVARELLAAGAGTITVVIGLPMRSSNGAITNSLAVLREGKVIGRYDKRLLPTYDVFDEDRYFEPGLKATVIEVPVLEQGRATGSTGVVRVGLSICEDLWMGEDAGFSWRYAQSGDPVAELIHAGAQVVLSASASPFVVRKGQKHVEILAGHAKRHGVTVASVNQLGGNDELVFDGHAHVLGHTGELLASRELWGDEKAPAPLVVDVPVLGGERASTAVRSTALRAVSTSGDRASDERHVFHALRLGVRDYLHKTGFRSAIIGLSGGIDSALTCAIAVAALGSDNVLGVAMPGPYSSDHSKSDAYDLAKRLGVHCITLPLTQPFDGFASAMNQAFAAIKQPSLGEKLPDIAEENLQSRIRGTMLMTISNRTGAMVLTTGNKSELAVGYATLYGDMNGGLAVLSDLSKQWVYRLSRFISSEFASLPGLEMCKLPPIPPGSIDKPPSAELRPNQTDQDSLPPYEVLDAILAMHIEERLSQRAILARTAGQPGLDEATVSRVLRLVRIAEYKRKQAAIGLKITSVAFGSGRRMPIARK